jgi:glucokinase
VRLDRRGTILESRCSGWAVDARVRRRAQTHPHSVLARLVRRDPGHEARHLTAALRQGDPGAERILRETAATLAFGLSHVVHLFHPAVIVLGGGLARVGEPLRRAVAETLPRWVMRVFHPVPAVRLSRLGEDVVPVGALWLAGEAARR